MTQPKTLNEAREQLEAANTQLTELQSLVAAHDAILANFGIVRNKGEDGVVHYDSPRGKEYETQISELNSKLKLKEMETIRLNKDLEEREATISQLTGRNGKLEADAKTAETLARELVGNLGGAPLAVDSSQSLTSIEELRAGLIAEKDPVKRSEIFKRLQSMKNGAQK